MVTPRPRTKVPTRALHILMAGAFVALSACREPAAATFITRSTPTFAMAHVRVIDGTGVPARDDQTVVVRGGQIATVGGSAAVAIPPGVPVIDGRGRTVLPGLVGMHEHLFSASTTPVSTPRTPRSRVSTWRLA